METIKSYLDNMFMNLPLTDEVKRAKEELLQMMEDKYNELKASGKTENEAIGIVISEFGNLDEIAEELGISAYLNGEAQQDIPEDTRRVSFAEAQEYIEASGRFAGKIGIGVVLCIWAPIILCVLSGFAEGTSWENVAGGVGLLALLLLVAPAVAIFIYTGVNHGKYDDLKKVQFSLDYSTINYVKEEKENFRGPFAASITMGVVLCIVGVAILLAAGIIFEDNAAIGGIGFGILLFLVGVAVYLFIFAGMRQDMYHVLLQEEDYSYEKKQSEQQKKKAEKIIGTVGGIFWPLITCIYLIGSFGYGNWGTSWMIWPITGILFGVFSTIVNSVMGVVTKK